VERAASGYPDFTIESIGRIEIKRSIDDVLGGAYRCI
jgi:hypothetical protein